MSRRLLTAAAAALAPVATLWVASSQGVFPSPATTAVTAAVLAVVAVVHLQRGVRVTVPALWLAGLVGWAALAATVRPVDRGAAAGFVASAAVALVLAVLAGQPRAAAWGRLGVVAAGALAALWLLVERAVGGGRPSGPFENPNVAAAVIVIALALVPALHWHPASRLAVAGSLVAGTAASGSRAALVAAVAVGVIWALAVAERAWRGALAVLVAAAAVGLAWRLATDRDPLRFERARIWLVAVRTAAAEMPLGCGPAGYADAAVAHNFAREGELARYYRLPTLAESDPLQLAAALGVPGLLLGLGLAGAVVLAARGRAPALAPCVAVAVTSALHTQLPLPAVAWTAALAVFSSLPRSPGRLLRVTRAPAAAAACALAAAAAAALGVLPGRPITAAAPAAAAAAALAARDHNDVRLADAEAQAWQACSLRSRWASAWTLLGRVRLERALARGDTALASASVEAFVRARRENPLDVWAALGEGRARRSLGDRGAAEGALATAVRLEPACAPAWVELALLDLDAGAVDAARRALAGAEAALARARGTVAVSDYERALAGVDHLTLKRLRLRCGVTR